MTALKVEEGPTKTLKEKVDGEVLHYVYLSANASKTGGASPMCTGSGPKTACKYTAMHESYEAYSLCSGRKWAFRVMLLARQ